MPPSEAVEVLTSSAAAVETATKVQGASQHIVDVMTMPTVFAMILFNLLIVTGVVYPLAKRNPQLARMKLGLHLIVGGVFGVIPGAFPADWWWSNRMVYGVIAGGVAFGLPAIVRTVLPARFQRVLDVVDGTQELRAVTSAETKTARKMTDGAGRAGSIFSDDPKPPE